MSQSVAAPPKTRPAPPPPQQNRPHPERARAIAWVVVGAGVAGVAAMWWQDTPAGSLRTWADRFTAAGQLTALTGTWLLLAGVVLMARVPWLERPIGLDRLAVWHARATEYAVALLSAHAVATTLGYALKDHRPVGNEAKDVVLHYPDVLAATVALGAMLAIGITSARALRRRISYHTWYFIHVYAYLAIVLSFAHQLATGNEFVASRWHRVVWIVVHIAALLVLLSFRVVVPAVRAMRTRMRVTSVETEAPGVVSLHIGGRRLDSLQAEAGQFFLWRFLTREGWWQAHPFSLSAAPTAASFRITVKNLGDHTGWLQSVRPGTRVIAEGPYGAVTAGRRTTRKVVLLAGGIGVTPLRALFESLPARPGDITFLYRARSDDDLIFRDELEELARTRRAKLEFLVGTRNSGAGDPLHPSRLAKILGHRACDVFVCGSAAFVDHAVANLRAAGLPSRYVHAERFAL